MDYEKKYKEAIELMKDCIPDADGLVHVRPQDIFHELEESEDEKTKRLLHTIANKMSRHLRDIFTEEEFQCFDAWSNAWLEKQCEQKTTAWTPMDEQRVENLLAIIEGHGYPGEVTWLNSLEDRVQPQPKQGWSEEDEKILDGVITNYESGYLPSVEKRDEIIEKLKSIRSQSTWKPSEKHYELEEFAKIVRGNLTGISKAVQKLFEAKYLQLTGNKMYGGFKD